MRSPVLAASLMLMWVSLAAAQTQTGSITGTVTDPSGQVIPGAQVALVNEGTGEERQSIAGDTGDFVFTALQPGTYTIRISAPGFRPLERKGNVVVAAGRLALGSLPLEVGSTAETVTVTAQGAQVETTTTAHASLLDSKQVAMISIRGRDPISLLRIMPGVRQGVDQDTFGGSFSTPVPAIMGQTGRQTLYVDGVNGGDGGNGGGGGANFSGATNLDAIAEVNVQMATYTAEYGLKGGPQVNFITKRGGSEFHGSAYWYKRHEQFNATNFFNNVSGVRKPVYRYSTLGGNIGGPVPVKIPLINPTGKQFFFFYSLDDTQLKDANPLRRYTMPTDLERKGDFSQTRTTAGALIPVRDPVTQVAFPNNVIPSTRAHPAGVALLNMLPLPNTVASGYNYLTQEASIDHPRRQHLFKVDVRPSDKNTISFKYQTWYTKSVGWEVAARSSPWGLVRQRYDFTADQGKVEYTRIITPHIVNEFGIGVFYSTESGPPEDDKALASIQRQNTGLRNLKQFAPQHNPYNLIPRVMFGTLQSNSASGLGQSDTPNITYDGRWPLTGADTAFPISDNLTWTRGAHTFKFGGLREHERFGQARSGTFGGEFSFANDGNDPTNSGFAYANAYLGHVTSYTESLGRVPDNFYQSTWAWFLQDTWRVRRGLTLDFGVRMYRWGYPLWGGGEASAFTFDRFDPKWGGKPPVLYKPVLQGTARRAQNPLTGEILPSTYIGLMVPGTGYTCGVITPSTPCKINGIVVQNDPTYTEDGKGFVERLPVQVDPRFGVAWDPFGTGKTAIRASFGAFHQATGGFAVQGGGPAFRFDQVIRYTDLDSYLTGTGVTSPNVNVTGAWRLGAKQPVTYNYTLAVQRDLGRHLTLDVAYVGSNTHHQSENYNFNAIPAGARFRAENRDVTVTATAANPAAMPTEFLRPYVGFGDINIAGPATTSRYDSLQAQVNRRFARGLELASTLTWAGGTSNGRNQNNPLPSSAARTRNDLIQKLVLNVSYVVDMPRGSKLVPIRGSKWVLDDWQVSGISTFATGQISNVTATFSDSFDFSGGGETCGSIVQTGNAVLPRDERGLDRWFNTGVFLRPTGRGDVGNNCNNAKFILPGFNNHDLSIFKNFRVREKQALQFRWEMYNALNHTQFSTVNTGAQFDAAGRQTNVNFGRVTAARNERRMQFSLRYSF
jgi:hypothetical protein